MTNNAATANVPDEVQEFWKTLERRLKVKPTRDGMVDVFDEYRHLSVFIENDAAENDECSEMLELARSIRDMKI